MRNDVVLNQDRYSEGDEKRSDRGYILKAEWTVFPKDLLWDVTERGDEDDS